MGALILILILASLVLVCSVLQTTLRPVATYSGGPLDRFVTETRSGWRVRGLQNFLRVPYSALSTLPFLVLVLGLGFGGD